VRPPTQLEQAVALVEQHGFEGVGEHWRTLILDAAKQVVQAVKDDVAIRRHILTPR